MNTEKLVSMANQISSYFAAYPEEEAVAGVQQHIHDFWTPKMVDALRSRAAGGADGMHPLARAAMLRGESAATSPTERAAESAREAGQAASDAG